MTHCICPVGRSTNISVSMDLLDVNTRGTCLPRAFFLTPEANSLESLSIDRDLIGRYAIPKGRDGCMMEELGKLCWRSWWEAGKL
jgi:hypothetical protein